MKKFLMLVMLLFCCSRVFAVPFNQIIFFGDSLSDNGNLYRLLLKIIPKSPPYFKGRFSNGEVWAEGVGKYFYDKYYIDYQIYALGGATAIFHLPTSRFISPTNLELEINNYLVDHIFSDKSQTLFSIWIGGNDYLYYQDFNDPDELTSKVVNKIAWGIQRLIDHGAQHFFVMNLPDLSKTPFARANGSVPALELIAKLHNQKLATAIDEIKALNPEVKIIYFDTYNLFVDVVKNPGKFNDKYKVNITNMEDACWQGGYMLNDRIARNDLNGKIRKLLTEKNGTAPKDAEVEMMSNMIFSSPALSHTYTVGGWFDQGLTPCANANEHLFWDEMHPTAVTHYVLSQIVIERLASETAH